MKYNPSTHRGLAALGLASLLTLAFTACNSGTNGSETGNATETTAATDTVSMDASMVYVGTYAEPDSESVFLYKLNTGTGELTRVGGYKAGENPSFLTLDEQRNHLYAVNETTEYEGQKSGAVSAFTVDPQSGGLTFINKVASEGGAPCYISLDGKTALVANYVGGNVASFPIQENGGLGKAASVKQHEGTGPNKDRQEAPHAHYIAPGPEGTNIFSVDLGADKVLGYHLDGSTLVPNAQPVAFASKPGSGPRHLAFHPNGKYAYLIHELNSTMTALAYNAENGTFTEVQTLPTIPADYKENNQPAEVKVSADGKFVYGSNRGQNSIVVYAIDQNTGKMTEVQNISTGGDWPRDFNIDRSGQILMVANERSNSITTFKIDKATGKLTPSGHEAQVHKPVYLQVVPAL